MYKSGRGILQAATVSGKTFMMTKLIGSIKASPFIFFVPSVDIMDQAYDCMSACLTAPIGRIGDGVCDIQEINVVMIQTAVKAIKRNDPRFKVSDYKFDEEDAWDTTPIAEEKAKAIDKLIRSAAGVYLDEVHHAASRTCQTIMEACTSAYYRFGGSATPFREDGAEKMIKALFGKVVQKVSASWLIRNQYLVKPYIFNVKMSGMHGDWKSYPQVYKNYIVENDDLHKLVGKLTMRMKQMGIPTLILVQQYQHGNTLKKIIPDATFIRGDMARTKRRDAISSLRNGSLPCAIATTLADEGLDVERLGCAIIAGGGKSCTRVYQRVGRKLRDAVCSERCHAGHYQFPEFNRIV
jgi:superfamily II DNA or RNA helicase